MVTFILAVAGAAAALELTYEKVTATNLKSIWHGRKETHAHTHTHTHISRHTNSNTDTHITPCQLQQTATKTGKR
jgi:hypothetical protein